MDDATKATSAGQTPEERALSVLLTNYLGKEVSDDLRFAIAEAIRSAETDEREACAAICDEAYPPRGGVADENAWIDGADHCAQAIRRRGQKERVGG